MKKLGTVNQNQDKQGKIISKLIKTWSFFCFFVVFFQRKLLFFILITYEMHLFGFKSFEYVLRVLH